MNNDDQNNYLKARREKIAEWMEDPEKFKKLLGTEITEKDIPLVHDIARESRLNELFDELNIDSEKLNEIKKQVIRLSPKKIEYPLFSTIPNNHSGRYILEDLLNEYHDSILRDGIMVGMDFGKKFIVEDIQNNRFSKEDIMNMTQEEIDEYRDEIRDEI